MHYYGCVTMAQMVKENQADFEAWGSLVPHPTPHSLLLLGLPANLQEKVCGELPAPISHPSTSSAPKSLNGARCGL